MLKPSIVLSVVMTVALTAAAQANVITGVTIQDVSSQLVTGPFDRAAAFTVTAPGLNVVTDAYTNVPDNNMWLNTGNGAAGGTADTAPQITWNLGSLDYVTTMRVWNYNEVGNFTSRGIHTADIYVSNDGASYTYLESVMLNKAPGTTTSDFSQFVTLDTDTQYIRFTNITDFPGADNTFVGLSAVQFNTVPEPSSLIAIVGLGGMGLLLFARRRSRSYSVARKLGVGLACLVACLVCSLSNANASTLTEFLSAPNHPDDTRTDTFNQAGFGFYANPSGTESINELGFWVSPADSGNTATLAISHQVALYHFNGTSYTEIATGTVAAGSTPDSNGYAWVSIPGVTLSDTTQSGTVPYIVEAAVGTDVWTPNSGNAHTTVVDANFGTPSANGFFTANAFPGIGGTETFNIETNNGGYFGPNIGLVPEPSSIVALCGLGLAGLTIALRRHRNAA
jgi:hypothetical protein